MVQPEDSLGITASFDNDAFRNAVRFAMQMGINPDPDRRPIFIRKATGRTYKKDGVVLGPPPRMDRDGKPLDPDIEVIKAPDVQVSVDCAIEVERADAEELPVGNFRPTKVVVTLLDNQYTLVKDCRELLYNGDRYLFGYEPESTGLFEVGVYTMIFYALDES